MVTIMATGRAMATPTGSSMRRSRHVAAVLKDGAYAGVHPRYEGPATYAETNALLEEFALRLQELDALYPPDDADARAGDASLDGEQSERAQA
jgi:hypothetical protein